jgi:N utilization substance protein B
MAAIGAQRRHERERALELLYEAAIKERTVTEVVASLAMQPPEYTRVLLTNVEREGEWAKALIVAHAFDWSWERMALIDRLIMTLALCELHSADSPPRAVVLDEAVELARRYSTDNSPGFINGVLAACCETIDEGAA